MQKIAILSDTHWDSWAPTLPSARALMQALQKGYHQIWHAGDVVDESVLVALEEIAPVLCVKGNCDTFFGRTLPHTVHRTLENVSVGMIHGWDLPLDHAFAVVERFPDFTQVIIHGHTHKQRFEEIATPHGLCAIINPGSVTSPRGGETPGFGELVINGPVWSYRRHDLIG